LRGEEGNRGMQLLTSLKLKGDRWLYREDTKRNRQLACISSLPQRNKLGYDPRTCTATRRNGPLPRSSKGDFQNDIADVSTSAERVKQTGCEGVDIKNPLVRHYRAQRCNGTFEFIES
jgi:hypothetical protein